MEQNIADYDKFEYDYEKYWDGKEINRSYEDKAERYIVNKLLPKPKEISGWFCDLGGGFGRLADIYKDRYGGVIIADYSIENLKKARGRYKNYENIFYVAANAYSLPFAKESLDYLMTVRLMHHLEDVSAAIKEISRVERSGGQILVEFSNKKHFVEILRFLTKKSKMKPFALEPEKRGDLFYNFHPRYIKNELVKNGFQIQKKISVSNFRSGIFKKIFPPFLLLNLDKVFRLFFNLVDFGPSIFFLAKKKGEQTGSPTPQATVYDLQTILICPKCSSGDLIFLKNEVRCKGCERVYSILDNIYDFRV